MKVSLKWLKKYINITSYTPEKIAEILTTIGLEVEGMEKVESIKGGLKGIVIGEVIHCEKHPDADKLSLTQVNIGSETPLQIVCGAPNVAQGQKVLVATIGTVLYNEDGSSFTIKKGKIRGVESQGMICAEDELGLGHDHSGIVVLPADTQVGINASSYYNIEDDYVFEIGLTPNRSDATSHLGVARDILAYLKVHEAYVDDIIDADISDFVTEKVAFNVDVEVNDTKSCPRYTGITITGVNVGESTDEIKQLLTSIGVKPVNNIVDITNFVLHELGQPLHAFDADTITDKKIVVTHLQGGTEFTTLDDVSRKLHGDDLMICDGKLQPLTIAGVYGGLNSGITSNTKNVFLESAYFAPTMIRKTSNRHNLKTDAARTFEKGTDPNITEFAIKRAAALIRENAGGAISNIIIDKYPKPSPYPEIRLRFSHVNKVLGITISQEDVVAILSAMDMDIKPLDHDSILVKVPTNKVDVTREIDLIEEIVRIYGLNNIPTTEQIKSTISYTQKPDKQKTKELIANYLASNGYNEMMGLSLIESRFYQDLDFVDSKNFVYINNTSNVHLDIMRPDMLVSGLQSIAYNLNRQQLNLSLFELGKAYQKSEQGYVETEMITVFLTGKLHEESWLRDSKTDKSFFDIKQTILSILTRVNITDVQFIPIHNDARFHYGLQIRKGPILLAELGRIKKNICTKAGIKSAVYYGEILTESLLKLIGKNQVHVKEISKFPTVRRDLALIVDKSVKFADIEQIARQANKKLLKHIGLFDVYENKEQLGEDKRSIAISLLFENLDKTLNDVEIDHIMKQIIEQFENKLKAFIRK